MTCKALITANDCNPVSAPVIITNPPSATIGPPPAVQINPGDPVSDIAPTAPPVEVGGTKLSDLPMPDFSALANTAGTSAVIAFVVIAMLLFIIAVATAWPLDPHRLRNFAVASLLLPMSSIVAGGAWSTPWTLLWSGAESLAAADFSGLVPMLAVAGPAAMLLATLWWAKFLVQNASVGQKSLARTERVRSAMANRRSQAAARAAKMGAPYSTGDSIVLGVLSEHVSAEPGGFWRSLTARHMQWLTIPHADVKRHIGLMATTGAGKTTMLERHFLSILITEWKAWDRWKDVPLMRARNPRPLVVMIACKGGEDDRVFGETIRKDSLALGIEDDRIAVVPARDRLDIWNMPARDLRGILMDLMVGGESTTSEGQHFDEMRKRIVTLVVDAPIGPPRSSEQFLARLDAQMIVDAWGGAPDVVRQVEALQAEKVPQLDDALIKMSNLFAQLEDHNGNGVFDGGKDLDDLDVLYVTVPGMDPDAGRAQVAAIIRMIMQRAGRTTKDQRRSVSLIIDELSAVATQSQAIGLENVAERGRSQGVALTFAAQSQEGVARDQWSLNRLLKACAGGLILGYSENAGDVCKHFGSVRSAMPSRHLIKGQRHGDEGSISYGEKWLVDPDRVRQMATGEVVYAKQGHAYYGRVVPVDRTELKPLPGTRAADTAAPIEPEPIPA
ncbi:hypothetical protein AB0H20_21990 [Nocardia fluminea]|uniref:hypothetical protein n=1 Tax=Nocardia fluminea TaxID=134984 RepID=UPI0033F05D01